MHGHIPKNKREELFALASAGATFTELAALYDSTEPLVYQAYKAFKRDKENHVTVLLPIRNWLTAPIRRLRLGTRIDCCLKSENIYFVGELLQRTEAEVLKMPNVGKKTIKAIQHALAHRGLSLTTVYSEVNSENAG
jgi:DNA-directed RNA polymerase alpha subunit